MCVDAPGAGTMPRGRDARTEAAMTTTRIEHDTFGDIDVPADRLWGAQTQRSLQHFAISTERMPRELLRALACVKRCAAEVNAAARPARRGQGRRDRRRGRRGARRSARRRVPALRLADRLRHADQHEHERGAGEPRLAAAGRHGGHGAPRAPQRRREPRPVVERRVPDRDERRRRARDRDDAAARARHAARHARGQGGARSPTS